MSLINLDKCQKIKDIDYDYTIIGCGAAGILLAIKLTRLGNKVNVIESGHFEEDATRQSLNEVDHTAKLVNSAVWGRKRAIGGTTIAWGGQSLPFVPIDFKKREWLENSNWPISFSEISNYYNEANGFMRIDLLGYDDEILRKLKLRQYKFTSDTFDYHASKWAKEPNFFKLYRRELGSNVDVYYNANVVGIGTKNQKADLIKVSNFNGTTFDFRVKTLIIASGGLESVRMLLTNKLSSSGLLGKCFMEHPCIEFGEIRTSNSYLLQRIFNTHIYKGNKYSLRLSLNENFQTRACLLNASVSILFKYRENDFNPYHELKSFLACFDLKNLLSIISKFKYLIPAIFSVIKDGFLFKPKSIPKLTLMMEQEPLMESFITLSEDLDAFQIPKLSINWKISDKSFDTFIKIVETLPDYFKINNLGEVVLYERLLTDGKYFIDQLSAVNHHMGGARMGASRFDSVVDQNLKLWDYENIYICSSSVFPTSSHSNPTLTLLAFACRLVNLLNPKAKGNAA